MLDIADAENDTRLILEVLGYQFPKNESDRSDLNWLRIAGRVRANRRSWKFVDPCLTTFELEQLRRWFLDVQARRFPVKTCSFTEPNLEFSYDELTGKLEVRFRLESAPPELPVGEDRFEGGAIRLDFSSSDAAKVVAGIDHALQRFPERSAVG